MKKNRLLNFFDKFEDENRSYLSRSPVLYALIGGTGIVLFWRGVWHLADTLFPVFLGVGMEDNLLFRIHLLDGLFTFVLAIIILLSTGLLVTNFIGNKIIISGIKHEKKLEEKEVEEIESEEYIMHTIHREILNLRRDIEELKNKNTR